MSNVKEPSPSLAFDEDAALYDAVRPAYPNAAAELSSLGRKLLGLDDW